MWKPLVVIGGKEGSFGGLFSFWDSPNAEEADDVVDPVDVKEFFGDCESLLPPGKVGLTHGVPVEEGKAPVLAEGIVGVGGCACVEVEMKELGVGPDVIAVGTEEDGDVSFEKDVLLGGVGAHLFHLRKTEVLEKGIKVDVVLFGSCVVGGPINPVFALKLLFECFE